ncbi:hypothetical protein Y013_08125 [Rhodococcus pyridinivorans SB3094]|uniref:DUF4349 domain-containing protein n=1 Tax=Rhodococcus pyridinivorans SB3094 TaxID=1435356 RepID=V9XF24_9NOCA|nr:MULTISPECIES: DUF4349 domain-containing protein [Rhodococcus]AHD20634.1 hypothetical protein Y013_08125 [Rhodococcus pyridinivorans SB3094]MCT7292353.1 DUF4349 domain-containing protein [Rhodococcus sp. PAE-6]
MKRLWPVSLALFALVVTGCDEGGGGEGSSASAPAISAPAIVDGGLHESQPEEADRKEVVTGYLEMDAGDPVATGRRVVTVVEEAGGRVDSLTEQPEASSVLTVRVPADRLDEVVDEICTLGRVTSLSTTRDDVTMQYTDLEARVGALRASVDRLRALLESSADVEALIAAETALAERQAELDSLEAQRRQLGDRIELSTLTVDITTDRLPSEQDSFWDGLVAGWNSLWAALGAAVVGIGAALPWVAFLFVCAGVLYLVIRLITRRGRSSGTTGTPDTERTDSDA